MADSHSLGDLADSISILRGRPTALRSVAEQEVARRNADALETSIFDALAVQVAQARARKYSEPGGPNEQGMAGRKFPLQVLEREPDPMQEILGHKAQTQMDQFKLQQAMRALVRNRQAPR